MLLIRITLKEDDEAGAERGDKVEKGLPCRHVRDSTDAKDKPFSIATASFNASPEQSLGGRGQLRSSMAYNGICPSK
jgi:hypothetical protein